MVWGAPQLCKLVTGVNLPQTKMNSGWQGLSGNEDGSLSLCLLHSHVCHRSPQSVGGYPLIAANEQKPSYISKEQKSLKCKGTALPKIQYQG